jgi:hypothetical protein
MNRIDFVQQVYTSFISRGIPLEELVFRTKNAMDSFYSSFDSGGLYIDPITRNVDARFKLLIDNLSLPTREMLKEEGIRCYKDYVYWLEQDKISECVNLFNTARTTEIVKLTQIIFPSLKIPFGIKTGRVTKTLAARIDHVKEVTSEWILI